MFFSNVAFLLWNILNFWCEFIRWESFFFHFIYLYLLYYLFISFSVVWTTTRLALYQMVGVCILSFWDWTKRMEEERENVETISKTTTAKEKWKIGNCLIPLVTRPQNKPANTAFTHRWDNQLGKSELKITQETKNFFWWWTKNEWKMVFPFFLVTITC